MSYICENCGKEFEEDWRKSPEYYKRKNPIRFCTYKCQQSFLGRKSQEKHPISERAKKEGYIHPLKGKTFKKKPNPCKCQYCNKEFKWVFTKNTHELHHCKENPNRIPIDYSNVHRTEKEKKHLSEIAKANNYGRRLVDSVKSNVTYKGVILGSSYEEAVAKSLDENNIKWIKPKSLKWVSPIDNREHNYYPDLYLPDYDVYLEPKNDYLINNVNKHFGIKDTEKVKLVEQKNNVKVIILDKEHLSWDKVKPLI